MIMTKEPPTPMEPMPWPAAFNECGWYWQLKWDGMRGLAVHDRGETRIWSKHGMERSARFPDVAAQVAEAVHGRCAVLDGEIVALREDGLPSFPLIMRRAMQARPSPALLGRIPAIYAVFDVLAWDGTDIRELPLEQRLARLEDLAPTSHIRHIETRRTGAAAFVASLTAAGLEGAVAKRAGTPYVPGPSPLWRKVKSRRTLTALIIGFSTTAGGRLRSLALAIRVAGAITYVGNVGSGLTEDVRARLTQELVHRPPRQPPLAAPHDGADAVWRWVESRLCATVTYAEWTPAGRLRSPVIIDFSADESG